MSETPHRIRSFLRQELPGWRAEGILDGRGEQLLRDRYGLGERASAGLALAALYVLAAALVGGGVVSLVAWHWDDMSRGSRLLLLGTAVVAAHLTGHHAWKVTGKQPRLGHAVSLLGTILFGASIALVAQIFQVSGPWYGAFGAWALGAAVAGLVLPSLPALCLAVALALFVWGPGFIADHERIAEGVAWLAGGASLALSLRFRSRVLYLIAGGGLAVVLAVAAAPRDASARGDFPTVVFVTVLAAAAALCAVGALGPGGAAGRFAPASAWLGRLGLYGIAYTVSFHGVARDAVEHSAGWSRAWLTCALPAALAAAAFLAAALRSPRSAAHLRLTAAAAVAFVPLFAVAVQAQPPPLALALLANAVLLVVAGARIAHGLAERARLPFWEGLSAAAVVAISRFFEIERLLWLKGAGFILCGLAVVAAALAFERGLRLEELEVNHG